MARSPSWGFDKGFIERHLFYAQSRHLARRSNCCVDSGVRGPLTAGPSWAKLLALAIQGCAGWAYRIRRRHLHYVSASDRQTRQGEENRRGCRRQGVSADRLQGRSQTARDRAVNLALCVISISLFGGAQRLTHSRREGLLDWIIPCAALIGESVSKFRLVHLMHQLLNFLGTHGRTLR
jgi:hypothetical protein